MLGNDPISQSLRKFKDRVSGIQSGDITDAPLPPPTKAAEADPTGLVTGDGKDWTVNFVFTTTCSHGQVPIFTTTCSHG